MTCPPSSCRPRCGPDAVTAAGYRLLSRMPAAACRCRREDSLRRGCDRLGHSWRARIPRWTRSSSWRFPSSRRPGTRSRPSCRKPATRAAAAEVKALAKPPVSAWVVNQLYWRNRTAFDRLLTAGARLRQAQASQLAGQATNLRELLTTHREALTELSRQAAAILSESGHQASPDVMRRVTMTLEGLAAQGLLAGAPAPGRLTADVDPPGFETIAALAPRQAGDKPAPAAATRACSPSAPIAARPPTGRPAQVWRRPRPTRRRARPSGARPRRPRSRRQSARLRRPGATPRRRKPALKKAAARLKDVEREKKDLEARLEKATAAADDGAAGGAQDRLGGGRRRAGGRRRRARRRNGARAVGMRAA